MSQRKNTLDTFIFQDTGLTGERSEKISYGTKSETFFNGRREVEWFK